MLLTHTLSRWKSNSFVSSHYHWLKPKNGFSPWRMVSNLYCGTLLWVRNKIYIQMNSLILVIYVLFKDYDLQALKKSQYICLLPKIFSENKKQ